MKKNVLIIVSSVMLSLLSCNKEKISGNGSISTQERNVSNFTAVSLTGSTNVFINQGTSFKVEVKGYSNLLPYFETRLVNNTLELGYKANTNVINDNTEVFITMPVLTSLSSEGSGNISTTGIFAGNTNFSIRTSGSGNINFSQGSTQNFNSSIEGSGNIYALEMITNNAETNITGSGNTEITANGNLKAKIDGSGNVYYHGTPVITTTITGSGAVIPK